MFKDRIVSLRMPWDGLPVRRERKKLNERLSNVRKLVDEASIVVESSHECLKFSECSRFLHLFQFLDIFWEWAHGVMFNDVAEKLNSFLRKFAFCQFQF